MPRPEQNSAHGRHGVRPLARRLSLRIRCARPEPHRGQDQKTHSGQNSTLQWIDALAESSAVRRTLVVVKRQDWLQPSSLERGSAATRTVVRSISPVC